MICYCGFRFYWSFEPLWFLGQVLRFSDWYYVPTCESPDEGLYICIPEIAERVSCLCRWRLIEQRQKDVGNITCHLVELSERALHPAEAVDPTETRRQTTN